jgi:tetratricopeptide (TPR) repeat protein
MKPSSSASRPLTARTDGNRAAGRRPRGAAAWPASFAAAATALLLIVAGCAGTALPTRPTEREWRAIESEAQSFETIRNSAPELPATASRRERIERSIGLQKRLGAAHVAYLEKLKEYLDRTADPRAARLWAIERVRMADDYAATLARYDRAIALYEEALAADPANDAARGGLERARSMRYMSLERFAAVKKGMSEAEVSRIAGMPREDWIRQVTQDARVFSVWIYPKSDGGAAAIYFDAGRVYHTNWNAAAPPAPGAGAS